MTAVQQLLMSYGSDRINVRSLPAGDILSYNSTRNSTTGPTGTFGFSSYLQGSNFATTAGRNYIALWQATVDGLSTTSDVQINAGVDLVGTLVQYNLEPQDTADTYSIGGIYGFAGDGNGLSPYLEYGSESSTEIGIQSVQLMTLRLENNDTFTNSASTSTTTSATYQTKCSLTIPKTGFYLIIGSAAVNTATASSTIPKVRIFDGTTAYNEITNGYQKDTTNYIPYASSTTLNLTQGTTISLQYASNGTNTVNIRQACIACIYIGTSTSAATNMLNYYYAESAATSTTTNTAFQSKTSATHTIANPSNLHLLIGSAQVSMNNNTFSSYTELINTSTSVDYNTVDWVIEPPAVDAYYTLFCVRLITFTQASNTIEWRYRSENSAATAAIKGAHYALIDLGFVP